MNESFVTITFDSNNYDVYNNFVKNDVKNINIIYTIEKKNIKNN